jgi:hypothetical protein
VKVSDRCVLQKGTEVKSKCPHASPAGHTGIGWTVSHCTQEILHQREDNFFARFKASRCEPQSLSSPQILSHWKTVALHTSKIVNWQTWSRRGSTDLIHKCSNPGRHPILLHVKDCSKLYVCTVRAGAMWFSMRRQQHVKLRHKNVTTLPTF